MERIWERAYENQSYYVCNQTSFESCRWLTQMFEERHPKLSLRRIHSFFSFSSFSWLWRILGAMWARPRTAQVGERTSSLSGARLMSLLNFPDILDMWLLALSIALVLKSPVIEYHYSVAVFKGSIEFTFVILL